MGSISYTTLIEVEKSTSYVFKHITEVWKWWSKDFKGISSGLNDEFTVLHSDAHYSRQKLIEVIPDRKIVWLVTASKIHWVQNKNELTNTKMIFDLYSLGRKTVLHFMHEGLAWEKECYIRIAQSWDVAIKDRLFNFLENGRYIRTSDLHY